MADQTMQLTLKMLSDKTITLNVKETDTIDNIKAKISDIEGIPAHQQVLVKGETVLDGWEKALGDVGVKDGDELNLLVIENPTFELCCVADEEEEEFEVFVTVHAKMYVAELKQVIYSKLKDTDFKHIRPKMMRLWSEADYDEGEHEEEFDDTATLKDSGISETTGKIIFQYNMEIDDSEATQSDHETLELFFKTPFGPAFSMHVESNDKMIDIKHRFSGVPVEQMKLWFEGHELYDFTMPKNWKGIKDGSELTLTVEEPILMTVSSQAGNDDDEPDTPEWAQRPFQAR